jgi:capsule biosynthesis phosphatase
MPVNYVICAAGQGSRFEKHFPGIPKPLIKLNGRYLIDWSLDSLPIFADDTLIFITQKTHNVKAKLYDHVKNRFPFNKVEWLEIEGLTSGQLETALLAKKLYDKHSSLAIFNCDTFFQSKTLLNFINNPSVEGIIPCSQEKGDSWSFCKVDKEDNVTDVTEKNRISDLVSVGLYFFRDLHKFIKLAEEYLKKQTKAETYVAPFCKEYLAQGLKLVVDRVSLFKPMGTVEQIQDYWKLDIEDVIKENFKRVLVVDLDNTITLEDPAHSYSEKRPNLAIISKLKAYKALGYEIILYTARRMKTFNRDESKVVAQISSITMDWLKQHDVPFDGIKFGKPFAENGFYIDDRAIRPDEFLKLSVSEINKLIGHSE